MRVMCVVTAENCKREDSLFWVEKATNDISHRLELVEDYDCNKLSKSVLVKHGFKGNRSFLHPMKRNKELLEYIDIVFDK